MFAAIFALTAIALVALYIWARRSNPLDTRQVNRSVEEARAIREVTSLTVNHNSMLP